MKAVKLNWDSVKGSDGNRLSPGYHQVKVVEVKDDVRSNAETDGWEYRFESLAGAGFIKDTFWLTEKAFSRLKLLCDACGVKLKGEQTLGAQQLVGRTCWLLVETDRFTGRDGQERDGVKVSPYSFSAQAPQEHDKRLAEEASARGR